ncbi:MAG: hypothetical protein M3Y27_11210 [Acidobacteriota bacterium]|nr:hypothetical protein [Acidobacteriota bacterium]
MSDSSRDEHERDRANIDSVTHVNKQAQLAFGFLQIAVVSALKDATNISSVPANVEKYEAYLHTDVKVMALPQAILGLTHDTQENYEVEFDPKILLNHPPAR